MLLDFDAGEVEIHGLRLTFGGLDANEEHGIYEVLAKDGRVEKAGRLRSRRSLLEGSLSDGVSWVQFSPNPVLSVGEVQATAGRVLVLSESHISVADASRITLRVRGVAGGELQRLVSGSTTTWELIPPEGTAGSQYQEFSLADLRAGKIGFLAGDGTNDITFTIQAEDDDGNLSDSDSVSNGHQPSSIRIPVVGLVEVGIGETISVNLDGALTPLEATLELWRGAASGGALTILVELHGGSSTEELLLGSHGVTSIRSSWIWDAQSEIGTLSLEDIGSASASDFRAMLDVLQLRSAVGASDSYRRILVRPAISGSAFKKDFHVREVKVSVNDAPQAPAGGLDDHAVKEDVASDHASATYVVPAFPDKEDDAANKDLTYGAKLVVGGVEQDLPTGHWIEFDKDTQTFTFAPLASHVGSHTLRVRGTDSGGLWVEDDFEVVVSAVNDAPEASAVPDKTVDEDATVTYQVLPFTDEDDDTTSASFEYVAQLVLSGTPGALPSWITFDDKSHDNLGNLNPTFRTFTFTPSDSSHVGDHTLRVTGTDDGGKSDFVEFKVTVAEVNDVPKKPVAGLADPDDVDEDTSSTYKFDAFTDEETSPLTYTFEVVLVERVGDADELTLIPTPDWIKFDADSSSATFRTFTFTPTLSSHAGKYKVRVKATDAGIGGDAAAKKNTEESAEDVFELVVSAVNDAPKKPAAGLADKTVDEDATVTYQVLPFTDEDDDTTSASFKYVAQLVSSGTLGALPSWITFDADSSSPTFRTFTFTPSDSSHVGDHTLRVTGTDDGGKSDFVEFKVTVAEVNDVPKKPVAGLADPDDVDEDTSSTYKFDAFTDEETSPLTYTFEVVLVERVGDADELTLIPTPDWIKFDADSSSATFRTFTFTPTLSSHAGKYKVRVKATDAGIGGDAAAKKKTEESAEDVFELVVSAVNDAPEASAVPDQTVDEDATVTYQVLPFTDEDDDTTSASFKYVAQLVSSGTLGALPSWITFDADSSSPTFRTFTFTPSDSSHVGDHTLRVTGTDDEGLSDFVEFKVKVGEVNDAPAASSVPDKTVDEDATVTYQVLPFTDEDDDTASASFEYEANLVVVDQNGAEILSDIPDDWIKFVAATRTFTFTPEAAHVGDYTLRVTGTDSGKKSDFVDFKVTVKEVNDPPKPPTAGLDNQEVDEDVCGAQG